MRIAVFCPPLPGHLNPIAVLGRALVAAGHQVIVFQLEEFRAAVEAEELTFCALGPPGSALASRIREMGNAEGLQSLQSAVAGARDSAENICVYAPKALRDLGIDLVLVDQNEPAGGTVAEHLNIPFISLCPSLPLNREPAIPPPFVGWKYSDSLPARLRNSIGLKLADLLIAPINRTLNGHRKIWNLPPIRKPDNSFSKLAQLSQMVRELDFPRRFLPNSFHYLGPWLGINRKSEGNFPYNRLDGRPLVYASFGTLQPGALPQFEQIAIACNQLNLQLVLATGAVSVPLAQLAGNPVVVPYAPQLDLIRKAIVVVTHGGMNTVIQALSCGRPMLAIPQTHDQPAIAARLNRVRAALVVDRKSVTGPRLFEAIQELTCNPAFGDSARKLQTTVLASGGSQQAVTIIEKFGSS